MPPSHRVELDESTISAVQIAAAALAGQDGRGVSRQVILRLASAESRDVTVLQGEPTVAIVHPARPGGASVFGALTARELEVAALLAAGRDNRQIASELVVTVATVKDHVHRILRKTGLPSRAAVGAAWRG